MSCSARRSALARTSRSRSSSTRCSPATRSAGWRSCDWSRWSCGWRQIWQWASRRGDCRAGGARARPSPAREPAQAVDPRSLPRRAPGRRARGDAGRTRTLRDELGLDPSQALQQLEKAILLQDPSLLPWSDPAEPALPHADRLRSTRRRDLQRPPPSVPPAAPSTRTARASATHAALRSPPTPLETRKTVTVLFCDVVASTELGGRLDPEALRARDVALLRPGRGHDRAARRHGREVHRRRGDGRLRRPRRTGGRRPARGPCGGRTARRDPGARDRARRHSPRGPDRDQQRRGRRRRPPSGPRLRHRRACRAGQAAPAARRARAKSCWAKRPTPSSRTRSRRTRSSR